MEQESNKKSLEKSYDKYYKFFIILPVVLLLVCLGFLYSFQLQHGDIIKKDITLTGGTSVEVNTNINLQELRAALEQEFEQVNAREVSDIRTGEQVTIIIETTAEPEQIIPFLENYLGFELTDENSSVEFTGSSLSGSFYNQLRVAIILSFVFMAIVVFFLFRTLIPSIAVVFAAFADIVMTLTIVNLLGMSLSTAGIVAFLMLIGYSVDTDILLTTKVIKRKEGEINSRIVESLKTGATMTLSSLVVVIIALIITSSFSKVFSQIFTILAIGLVFDLFNTWFFNASIIKWYAEKKEK